MPRLLLVGEQALVRAGIKRLIEVDVGIKVVAETSNSQECINKFTIYKPDIVIIDFGIEDIGLLDAIRRMLLIDSNVRVIVIITSMEPSFPERVLKLGVSACLSKCCSADELYSAIRAVENSKCYVSSKVAQQMLPCQGAQHCHSPFLKLSNRELQIMFMFIRAMNVHDVSARLYLSPKTISTYRYRIFAKLGVRGDVEMTLLAIRHGILDAEYVFEEKWAS